MPVVITAVPREGPEELAPGIFRALGVHCRDAVVTSGLTVETQRASRCTRLICLRGNALRVECRTASTQAVAPADAVIENAIAGRHGI